MILMLIIHFETVPDPMIMAMLFITLYFIQMQTLFFWMPPPILLTPILVLLILAFLTDLTLIKILSLFQNLIQIIIQYI